MGVFGPRNHLFQEMGVRAPVWGPLRLLNALNSEDRGLKVRFSLATIVFEIYELTLCQMLSSQGKNAPSNPYPHYLVRLATSRSVESQIVSEIITKWNRWEFSPVMFRSKMTRLITLSFLSLFFWKQGKPPKKQGFFIPTEPLKSLEKKGKTLKKTRNSSQGEKTRNPQKTRKGRTGYWENFIL